MPDHRSTRLTMSATVDEAIRRHGEETYPHECCGALVGEGEQVRTTGTLPSTPVAGPRRRVLVRLADYRPGEQRGNEAGGELLRIYHSHPDHPSRPHQYHV